jgi:hypothetical protein
MGGKTVWIEVLARRLSPRFDMGESTGKRGIARQQTFFNKP